MKVKELIQALQLYDGDTEVQFSYNYGDHRNTEVSEPVEIVGLESVQWSDYHNMFKVLSPDDSGSFKDVILLR